MFIFRRNKVDEIKKVIPINSKNRKTANDQNILKSMRSFMVISQIFGLLPQGNLVGDVTHMSLKWSSLRMLHTLSMISLLMVAVGCCFVHWIMHGSNIILIAIAVCYGGSLATMILHLRLDRSWSKLMTTWKSIDKIMNTSYGYPEKLDGKIKMFTLIFLLLGITDYVLSSAKEYADLNNLHGSNISSEIYFNSTFPQLFAYVPFNTGTAILCTIVTFYADITWSFNDLFIIIVSSALALRFQQIGKMLDREKNKNNSSTFWRKIREDYNRLASFCKELDSHISGIVLLSYFLNIFFLLIHLYDSLESKSLLVRKVHSMFIFAYLIFKTSTVSLYAAWINDESKVPTNILNSVDSSLYNVEIRRLLTQISFDNTALTGCKMFSIKRGIVLSVASAIVTYELVLIQFSQANLYESS